MTLLNTIANYDKKYAGDIIIDEKTMNKIDYLDRLPMQWMNPVFSMN